MVVVTITSVPSIYQHPPALVYHLPHSTSSRIERRYDTMRRYDRFFTLASASEFCEHGVRGILAFVLFWGFFLALGLFPAFGIPFLVFGKRKGFSSSSSSSSFSWRGYMT